MAHSSKIIPPLLERKILPKTLESIKHMRGFQECRRAIFYLPLQTHQILSIISKLFESIITKNVFDIFSDENYGLRSARSISDVLNMIPRRISVALEDKPHGP